MGHKVLIWHLENTTTLSSSHMWWTFVKPAKKIHLHWHDSDSNWDLQSPGGTRRKIPQDTAHAVYSGLGRNPHPIEVFRDSHYTIVSVGLLCREEGLHIRSRGDFFQGVVKLRVCRGMIEYQAVANILCTLSDTDFLSTDCRGRFNQIPMGIIVILEQLPGYPTFAWTKLIQR